jgi:pyrroline-5-carboxylate reductase
MEEANLRTIIADAMNACAERADAMSKELSAVTPESHAANRP